MTLRGITWNHPRGYDPLIACSAIWQERTGLAIEWDKRSLQDFESYPVEELARRYDLLVIDHPHIGVVSSGGCLLGFDQDSGLSAGSVGASYDSYFWNGVQWALPIDAAAQVQAYRPDLVGAPCKTWHQVKAAALAGRVLVPLKPPHSLMCFFTLAANLGEPCAVDNGLLVDEAIGTKVFGMLLELASNVDPVCFEMDPIDALEVLAERQTRWHVAPLIYGYANYAEESFRAARIAFGDIPSAGDLGPVGSALGGTGIAVSAFTALPDAAQSFARWVASADVQVGPYAANGGQPGHAAAWEDPLVNERVHDFYRATRATLEGAWVRPRHNGYMAFQHAAADRINRGLRRCDDAEAVINDLNAMFAESFR